VNEIKTTDEVIESILNNVISAINTNKLTTDWKGDFFSSNQLNDIRRVFEKNGFESAKVYISGKMNPKGNRWELIKNQIILDLLEELNSAKSLDVSTKSYIIGKLNSILAVYKKGGKSK